MGKYRNPFGDHGLLNSYENIRYFMLICHLQLLYAMVVSTLSEEGLPLFIEIRKSDLRKKENSWRA